MSVRTVKLVHVFDQWEATWSWWTASIQLCSIVIYIFKKKNKSKGDCKEEENYFHSLVLNMDSASSTSSTTSRLHTYSYLVWNLWGVPMML